jgi:hypothetical protein
MPSDGGAKLELDEDLPFQEKQFRVERLGWGMMFAILIAALLGLFGSGPLSRASAASSESGLRVEYSRFARRDAHTRILVHLDPARVADDVLRIRLGGDFVERVIVQSITPAPERWTAERGALVADVPLGTIAGPMPLIVDVAPREFGPMTLELSTGSGRALTIRQFVYP